MNDKPLLFTGDMIRAILREIEQPGTGKTLTRRVIKPQPGEPPSDGAYFDAYNGGPQWNWWSADNKVHLNAPIVRCPYGHPGDLLWVRESHTLYRLGNGEQRCVYRATFAGDAKSDSPGRWRPSIHMPRWASRLTLRITDVRVERVQDIAPDDCRAEGHPNKNLGKEIDDDAARDWFMDLWDSINAAPKPVKENGIITHYVSYPWEDIQETREHKGLPWYVYGNPWVWPISFDVIHDNIDNVIARGEV